MRGRDRIRIGLGHLQRGEVAVHVRVQVEASAVDELHDGGSCENFANGSGRKNCRLWINALAGLEVRDAVTFCDYHLAVLDQGENRARDVLFLHPARENGFEQFRKPIRIYLRRSLARRGALDAGGPREQKGQEQADEFHS